MLFTLILLPLLAAIAILCGAPARKTALAAALGNIVLASFPLMNASSPNWNTGFQVLADPEINLSLGFHSSGASAVMLLLSVLITLAAVYSGKCPEGREKLWFSSTLFIAAGCIGAFLSTDVFFFYAFHELALIPTFLMIGILGRGERKQVAWKITIYLAFGSIVLLAGLLLATYHAGSFAMADLANAKVPLEAQKTIALLLIIGFGTLISLFPLHSWAAPAYASAPAPVSMLHAGVLKKFGLYGLLVVGMNVAPDGMAHWLPLLCSLLLGNIIWVGLVTINQKRLDLMFGNSSVMHMGYIFLAIAALAADPSNQIAEPAAVLLMFAHGISIALLFSLSSVVEEKTGTLEINQLGGLAKKAPALAFIFGLAGMASIGLPGLANFAGEIMVFLAGFASWKAGEPLGLVQITTIIALWGVVISAVYVLRAYRDCFQGPLVKSTEDASDLSLCGKIPSYMLGAVLLIVGIYPQIILQFLPQQ
ncbi:NADH-quinone oxidoreductase subunit M [Verrucomicrobiaceae bacterium N1E253]|uniref:NADH-quinone oxidoreductase subunit M n=1 Tax=Oceaniferula marina TaxID=2748318 RepID=A0A851GAR9_9BACT|nr:NADH-quinone oxidoreductase subunit M [Oceaniferula marina]NWK54062.1 NADH-quinone oxidoreductase subunit M [Oceaniferula marina]